MSACALDPHVEAPDLDLPPAFVAAEGDAARYDETRFWQGFDSPELDRLMAEAREANLDIAAAVARIQQADAQVRVTTGPLIPTLDANAQASRSKQGFTGSNGFGGGSAVRKSYQASLSAAYELDFWAKNLSALRSSEASSYASRYDAANVALATDASVASTYFQILTFRRRLEIARGNLKLATRVLEAVRARVRFGTATALDEAQQESLAAGVEAAIPPLEQGEAQATYALAILLGVPPERLSIIGEDPSAMATPRIDPGLPAELIARRPDIALAEAQLAAARFDVQSARAQLFPSIQITGQGGFASEALKSLFDPVGEFYQIVGGMTQPIFQLYPLQGQVDLQRGRYMELLRNYQRVVIVAFQDVDNALVAYQKTTLQEALQQRAVDVSRRANDIAQAQLREGVIDITTLLQTQQTLFSAQDTLAQVRLARLQAVVDLYQALGGGWTRPEDPLARVPPPPAAGWLVGLGAIL